MMFIALGARLKFEETVISFDGILVASIDPSPIFVFEFLHWSLIGVNNILLCLQLRQRTPTNKPT